MKSDHIEEIVYEIEQQFNASYTGLHSNSFNKLVYSEYEVKKILRHRWNKVQYLPFVYKGNTIWYVDLNCIIKLPYN